MDDSEDPKTSDIQVQDGMISKQSEHTPSMFDDGQGMDNTMKSEEQFDGTGGSSGNVN